MTQSYAEIHKRSLEDPEGFWGEAAAGLHWHKPWDRVLDSSNPPFYRWFAGAECNTCYNAVDRHVEGGRADQPALIYDSPITGAQRTYTYLASCGTPWRPFAGVLKARGIGKGDRVIVYMPMIPEAAIAMLAIARLGAIHSVVFGGFAANELAVRIEDAGPKAIVSASCGIEPGRVIAYKPLLDEAIELSSHKPDFCIVYQREQVTAEPGARPRRGLGGRGRRRHAGRLRAGRGDRPALHPLHLRHDRAAQGRHPRQWRPHGGAALVDEEHLRRRARRSLLGGLGRRLGGRPFLHRLRPAAARQHNHPVRGQAGRHARRRRVLAHHLRA